METNEEETIHICYFISGTGHKTTVDVYKFHFLPLILHPPCLQPAGQCSLTGEVSQILFFKEYKFFYSLVFFMDLTNYLEMPWSILSVLDQFFPVSIVWQLIQVNRISHPNQVQ